MTTVWAEDEAETHTASAEPSSFGARDEGREWWLLLGLVLTAAAIPFLVVEFPPIHDLPHHLAQARHYVQVDDWDSSPYRAHWLAPQNLIYVVLVPLWIALPPLVAGKLFSYLLLAGSICAIFHLARRRSRSPVAALAAAVFAFNFVFYSGFFAFQLGGALVLLWLASLPDRDESGAAAAQRSGLVGALGWLAQAAFLLLLGWAHALWLAVAGLVLGGRVAHARGSRASLVRLTAIVPSMAWLLPSLLGVVESRAEGGFPMQLSWEPLFGFRLTPTALVDGALGGLTGFVEPLLIAGAAVWIVLALWTNQGHVRERSDAALLGVAALLTFLWLVFPDALAMTIQASRRWLPYALVLGLLGLPLPRLSLPRLRAAVVLAHVALLVVTVDAWHFFDRAELTGFRESLEALPAGTSLLGLSFLRSENLKHGVFLQMHAWAEALEGAELEMSFTELGAGLVLRKTPRETPWTYGLSFFPHTVRQSDFYHFEHVLVSGPEDVHAQVERIDGITGVAGGLPWRLYRVERPSDAGQGGG